MGLGHLWDTNTAIYFVQNQFSDAARQAVEVQIEQDDIYVSVISEIELLSWQGLSDEDMEVYRTFLGAV